VMVGRGVAADWRTRRGLAAIVRCYITGGNGFTAPSSCLMSEAMVDKRLTGTFVGWPVPDRSRIYVGQVGRSLIHAYENVEVRMRIWSMARRRGKDVGHEKTVYGRHR
jgi:hypothetical protein